MRYLTFLLLLSTCLLSCNRTSNQTKIQDTNVMLDKIVILPYDSSKDCFRMDKPATLNQQELVEIEVLLQQALKTNPKLHPLAHYNRQYTATINTNNEKEVWVTLLCDEGDLEWKKQPIIKHKNDQCYINVYLNLTQKRFGKIMPF